MKLSRPVELVRMAPWWVAQVSSQRRGLGAPRGLLACSWAFSQGGLYPGGHSPCSLSLSVFSSWERPTEERDQIHQISESAGGEAPNLCFLP